MSVNCCSADRSRIPAAPYRIEDGVHVLGGLQQGG
jgi:hypothetical protein